MWKDAVMLTLCSVLFIQMGLAGEIERVTRVRLKLLECPKCCVFWLVLSWSLFHGQGLLLSVTASFLFSYAALWLSVGYDWFATIYNRFYETLENSATAPHPEDGASTPGANAVSQVRKKNKVK